MERFAQFILHRGEDIWGYNSSCATWPRIWSLKGVSDMPEVASAKHEFIVSGAITVSKNHIRNARSNQYN
jgi:hypothetical protein